MARDLTYNEGANDERELALFIDFERSPDIITVAEESRAA